MLILPSMGRPNNLTRFIESYHNTFCKIPIYVVLDEYDAFRYDRIKFPENWKRCVVPAGHRLGDIFSLFYKKFPQEKFYGMVADDLVPTTPRWDSILLEACGSDRIAWGSDGIQNGNLPTHPFIGGELVRQLGWWSAPGLKHWFVDNVWKNVCDILDVGVYLPGVKMNHYHYINGKAQRDRTYENQPDTGRDEIIYREFMQNEFPKTIERILTNAFSTDRRSV